MKVLHVINSLATGGAEKLLVDTLPLYVKRGIETELLLLNGSKTVFIEELKNASNIPIHHLGRLSLFNPILVFRIIPYLNNYDLIHVHLFPALYWVALAKTISASKTTLVFTKHSTSNRRLEFSFISKAIEKWILKKYRKIISISPEVQTNLINLLKFPLEKYTLIENGINLKRFEEAGEMKVNFFNESQNKGPILIQVSSFRIPKDQRTLIKALAILPENVKLLLAGDGPQKLDCERLAIELGVQKRIKFLGTRTDIPNLLKAADIVILSSGYEGFGLALVEGMAVGKPVIGSDVPGIRGTIQNAGITFPKGNEDILAKKILSLIENPLYYQEVSMACLAKSKNYDIDVMVKRHLDLYDSILSF